MRPKGDAVGAASSDLNGRMYHLGIRLPANQIFQYLADHAHPWVTFSFKF
jgi:hypothetical protein